MYVAVCACVVCVFICVGVFGVHLGYFPVCYVCLCVHGVYAHACMWYVNICVVYGCM